VEPEHPDLPSNRDQRRSIEIALAVFNGERFLEALLASLFAQGRTDFTVTVSDDGSTDGSVDIVESYARKYPGRMRVLAHERRLGVAANFSRLLAGAEGDIVLLCDQDDVWLPDKIALTIGAMDGLEGEWGADMPLLVHTDLCVVDEDLGMIASSLARYQRLDPEHASLRRLLLGNVATGCTLAVNRALRERALPVPAEALMHDHWLALVAATIGRTAYVPRATVLYRQHEGNVIGASGWTTDGILRRIRQTLLEDTKRRVLKQYSAQAGALLARYRGEMGPRARAAAQAAAELWSRPLPIAAWSLLRNRLGFPGIARRLAILATIIRDREPRPRPPES
jgi:hypothetical protein